MKMSILIVDDDDDLRELLSEAFEMENFKVYNAENGEKALESLAHNQVDIIISDAHMPVMGGIDFLSRLSEMEKMPLFYLATGDIEFREDKILELGGTGLLEKPYDIDLAIEKIKKTFLINSNKL